MKKTEMRDLIKSGRKPVMAKVKELKLAVVESKLKSSRGEEKNTAIRKNMKRTIARLLTHVSLMKEAK